MMAIPSFFKEAVEGADDFEKRAAFRFGEGGRGFIHDNDPGISQQRLGQLDQLSLAHGKFSHPGRRRNVKMVTVEKIPDDPDHFRIVQCGQPFLMQFPSEKDVFKHGQIVRQIQFLIQHGDPRIQRGLRIGKRDLLVVQQNFTAVFPVNAGKDLHQSRFSRAVFAAQGVECAGFYRESDIPERLYRSEMLGDMLHPQFLQRFDHKPRASG